MKVKDILGSHPKSSHPCGAHFTARDQLSDHGLPHRLLEISALKCEEFVDDMSDWIVDHHGSPEAIERDRKRREALLRLGFPDTINRFPKNSKTQKGNWAEILLAEYLSASCNVQVPILRLRYNPNVDQSMKGDDVLAFELDSKPVRVLVGEAKFRKTPKRSVVDDIVTALTRSHSGNIPASLQFVADRLFEQGQDDLGEKVAECNTLFAESRLRLDYVGFLVSNGKAHLHVQKHAKSSVPRLTVMSLALDDAEGIVTETYAQAKTKL
jgi:hypothetical protein